MNECAVLQRAPRGTYEIAQHGDVGAVGPDPSRVYRKSEAFSEIQVDAGVVQLRKTESLRGKHAIAPGRINRAGGAVMPPRRTGTGCGAGDLVRPAIWMRNASGRFTEASLGTWLRSATPKPDYSYTGFPGEAFSSPVVSNPLRGLLFRALRPKGWPLAKGRVRATVRLFEGINLPKWNTISISG